MENYNVAVVGGGNIGTALAIEFSNKHLSTIIYTSKPQAFSKTLELDYVDSNTKITTDQCKVTNDLSYLCENSNIFVVTLPSNAWRNFLVEFEKYVKPNSIIILLPGIGGSEFVFKKCIDKGCILIGLQRVPAVYRLKEYGKVATISGKRKEGLFFSTIPNNFLNEGKAILEELFDMKANCLSNYLNVTLTPSNPILHTTRLYSLFSNFDKDHCFKRNPLFYGEWNDDSSRLLIACDDELKVMKKNIDLDLSGVESLLTHYESTDYDSLTKKICSITSLNTISTPMVKVDEGYLVDWSSRYFRADFPNGIVILKSIALLCNVKTPAMDKVIFWYQKMVNKEYFTDHEHFGKDIGECNIPQNFGLKTLKEFEEYYR